MPKNASKGGKPAMDKPPVKDLLELAEKTNALLL
jgi:hypothetical protein